MGRMYGKGKGISSSSIPYGRKPPSWLKTKPFEVEEQIAKLAKKGQTPSQIGVSLRDSMAIPQVKAVTNNKILRILKAQGNYHILIYYPNIIISFSPITDGINIYLGLAPEIPEDLYFLIKKAVSMRKHMEHNLNDKDSKFRLILVESRIHRLARYYKKKRQLPATWKYQASTAGTLVA